MASERSTRGAIGADGLWTLALSFAVLAASGGLTLLYPLWRVITTARRAGCTASTTATVAVLGKRLRAGAPDAEFRRRLRRARRLHEQGVVGRIVLLGGLTGDSAVSEAAAGAALLADSGVPPEAITLEDRSRHTLENLDNMRRMLGPRQDGPLVLVSSRYHLARCAVLAAGFGLRPVLCAAEEAFSWRESGLRLLGEAFYLHWYWVGKGWSRLTRNRKSLARIS